MFAESKFAKESFFPPKKSFIVAGWPNGSVFCCTGGVLKTANGDGFDKLTDGNGGGDVNDEDDDVDARSEATDGGGVILIEVTAGGVAVAEGFAIAAVAGGVVLLLCISNVEPMSPDENFDGGEWSGPFGAFSGSGSTVCLTCDGST